MNGKKTIAFRERLRAIGLTTVSLFLCLGASCMPLRAAAPRPAAAPAPEAAFKLSDEELKMLNLGEKETQEIKQFFDALNNLTPEQKQELEELGRQTEESMRKKNLDPSNFEDLVKFMEEEGLAPQQPQPAGPPTRTPAPRPFAPERTEVQPTEKPLPVVVEAHNALALLNDLIKHLNSFKHKASLQSSYKNKIKAINKDLIEFSYYLDILKQSDLVALLGTAEFVPLYRNLEALRTVLLTYEPSIKTKSTSSDEDDPYEILDIPYEATSEEIQKTYDALLALYDPTELEKQLEEQGLDKKAIQKEVKKSRLFFSFIKEAYTSLKDPKQKAFIDRNLRHKQEQEKRRTTVSAQSFDKVMNALMTALRSQNVLQSIKGLIEKNKPQELIAARAEIEKEQKALERSKTPLKIAPTPPQPQTPGTGDKYSEFYQKMAMESFNRPSYPTRQDYGSGQNYGRPPQQPSAGQPSSPDGGAPKGGKTPGPAKPQGGKEKEKTETGTQGKPKGGLPKGKKEEETFSKEEMERRLALQTIEQILADDTKMLVALETPVKAEETEEGEEEKPAVPPLLPTLMAELERDLLSSADLKENPPAAGLTALAEKLKLSALKKELLTVVPKKEAKIEDTQFIKDWNEKIIAPYGKTIVKLHDIFYAPLDAAERKNSKPRKESINREKAKKYNLAVLPSGRKPMKHKGINLGAVKEDITSILGSFEKIEKITKKK
ncbi:hypothetical protein H0W26_01390 [Candidatus Dependentiae bacterium]|nr:hypothetical protein [Candidatus Dependentiae bacterium]